MNGKDLCRLREDLNDCNNESAQKEDGLYYEIKGSIEKNSYEKIWYLMGILDESISLLKYIDKSGVLTMKSKDISDFVKEYGDQFDE